MGRLEPVSRLSGIRQNVASKRVLKSSQTGNPPLYTQAVARRVPGPRNVRPQPLNGLFSEVAFVVVFRIQVGIDHPIVLPQCLDLLLDIFRDPVCVQQRYVTVEHEVKFHEIDVAGPAGPQEMMSGYPIAAVFQDLDNFLDQIPRQSPGRAT